LLEEHADKTHIVIEGLLCNAQSANLILRRMSLPVLDASGYSIQQGLSVWTPSSWERVGGSMHILVETHWLLH
jgi:hypothetical protein